MSQEHVGCKRDRRLWNVNQVRNPLSGLVTQKTWVTKFKLSTLMT